MTAPSNSPALSLRDMCAEMDMAPADWPMSVSRLASPPNAAMLARTHAMASVWSRSPKLPLTGDVASSPRYRKPNAPRRYCSTTTTTPVALAMARPSYSRPPSGSSPPA